LGREQTPFFFTPSVTTSNDDHYCKDTIEPEISMTLQSKTLQHHFEGNQPILSVPAKSELSQKEPGVVITL